MSQLFQTEDHYILHEGQHSLWCSRHNGTIEAKKGDDICSAWNPVCIGLVYGLIGKIKIHPDEEWRLLLIKERSLVGRIAEKHEVYRINKIVIIPLSSAEPQELDLDRCQVHHFGIRKNQTISQTGGSQRQLQNAWKTIKTGVDIVKTRKKEIKEREKFAKRICEEIFKLYNDTDSFFVCETFDLTKSIQRQSLSDTTKDGQLDWNNADPRFFWNRYMVSELLDMDVNEETRSLNSHWVVPIIQGYIQIENCLLDFDKSSPELSPEFSGSKLIEPMEYTIILISRRSIHRAGTRSKKRGIEDTGACANYVETEQIIQFRQHMTSFVQVRGSVPVYWSQSGLKYRPPPKLDRGDEDAYDAFCLHFEEQLTLYKSICVINLAELVGKEKALSDAYLHHVMRYNSPNITYVMFDFHEYCRGMKFENVTMLTDGISDVIRSMRYCWVGPAGMICEQTGVFRVNCVDCLDRTNVVQTAIARIVMDTQLRKLGILPPDEVLPNTCKRIFQQIWANNGDAISRQYAGTAALKGDYTRTGERKLTGMMKDGMNSANRYYLRFRDSHRQAAIDLTLGKPLSEEVILQGGGRLEEAEEEEEDSELLEKEENLRQLLEDSKRMLIVEPEECMGGWCLINADPTSGDSDRQDMDVILLLSQRAVYVAWYDDDEEQITQYQRIFLEDIEMIEIGAEPAIFKSRFVCMRLHYRHYADEGFFHAFRIPTMRLFNNMIVAVKSQEDAKELLRAVYQGFAAAQEILSLQLPLEDKPKLERKKTRPHPDVQDVHQQQQEQTLSHIHIPRDVSATDLIASSSSAHKPNPQTDNLDVTAKPNPKRSPGPPSRSRLFRMPDVSNIKKNIDRGLKNIQKVTSSVKSGNRSDKDGMTKYAGRDQNKVLKQQGSRDDSDVPESEDRRASTDLEQSIVLESCGLVSVGSSKRLSHGDLDVENEGQQSSPQESQNDDVHKETKSRDGEHSSCTSIENGEETVSDVPVDVQRRLSFLVPNLQLPSQKSRRVQRIFDNIQLDIQTKLKDKQCVSKIVFI